jgi:hypothetical protein
MRHLHILDSGAYTWWNKHRKRWSSKPDWQIYRSEEFWDYVKAYALFCQRWRSSYDYCINCDVIGNPKLSWKVLKYLESEYGLSPLPVIHTYTELKWIAKYLDAGYSYIGLGGGQARRRNYFAWADQAWNVICDTPDRLPACKVHGFAATTHKQMCRYPWYSCDSVTAKKMAYYGQVILPPSDRKGFRFDVPYKIIFMDSISPYTNRGNTRGRHYLHLSASERQVIRSWLKFIKVKYGRRDSHGSTLVEGVSNSKQERMAANIKYFLNLQKHIPKWPWPFHIRARRTLLEVFK